VIEFVIGASINIEKDVKVTGVKIPAKAWDSGILLKEAQCWN
jgi:hypothetical protein